MMSQPVKLSNSLRLDARITAEIAKRSIAGQFEFWARLERTIEPMLEGAHSLALRRAGVNPLSECLKEASLPAGCQRLTDYLNQLPFPHYEPSPDRKRLLVRIEEDGTRTTGRFINRKFKPVPKPKSRVSSKSG